MVADFDNEVRQAINDATIDGGRYDIAGAFGVEFFEQIFMDVLQCHIR